MTAIIVPPDEVSLRLHSSEEGLHEVTAAAMAVWQRVIGCREAGGGRGGGGGKGKGKKRRRRKEKKNASHSDDDHDKEEEEDIDDDEKELVGIE